MQGISCCSQIEILSDTFTMGTSTDPDAGSDEKPAHKATLDSFLMDKFEITVGRIRSFVQAFDGTMPPTNTGAHPQIQNSGWRVDYEANMPRSSASLKAMLNCSVGQYQTWTETAGVRETMPANCVSWYVAFAFCVWDGGRLPTEAEWEMAAANGKAGKRYPWGTNAPAADKHAVMACLGDGVTGCTPSDVLPVGSRIEGANQWGHLDLAGSMWEWTLDFYDPTYYQAIGTCANCSNLSGSTPRVIRGGSFTSQANVLRATARASKPPINAEPYTGFRCVRSR
jgi:formylglycine-generating enzyme required for sulfatase activity